MNKKTIVNLFNILMWELIQNSISYGKAQRVIEGVFNKNNMYGELIPNNIRENINSLIENITKGIDLLANNDKKIIESLLKEIYLQSDYLNKYYDQSLPYKDRELAKYNHTIKSTTVYVLLQYITEGVSLKEELSQFKADYKEYATKLLNSISNMVDNKNTDGLEKAIKDREVAADILVDKYESLLITDVDLRSCYENDVYVQANTTHMTEEEQNMFGLVAV